MNAWPVSASCSGRSRTSATSGPSRSSSAVRSPAPDVDPGLARAGAELLRELPRSARRSVLLCTDLHAENVLSAQREPWLVIDPKPLVGDPAFDPVQHMPNCKQRLLADPAGLAARMADLCHIDPERVRLWLFARCAQESSNDHTLHDVALRLAP